MASCRNDAVSTAPAGNYESGLKAGAVTDAAGRQIMPKGVVSTGSGGTAPPPPTSPVPWLAMIVAGALLAAAGLVRLRRPA